MIAPIIANKTVISALTISALVLAVDAFDRPLTSIYAHMAMASMIEIVIRIIPVRAEHTSREVLQKIQVY